MSEIRREPTSPTWVIIASERGKRPIVFKERKDEEKLGPCPLCEEIDPNFREKTLAEILKEGRPYPVFTLGNKYPALSPEESLEQKGVDQFYHSLNGFGHHELIVESPVHGESMSSMPPSQLSAVFEAYSDRYKELQRDPRIAYVLIFKNYRIAAGASLAHAHSQVIATPMIPHRVEEELGEAKTFYEQRGECVYCKSLRLERTDGQRTVYEGKYVYAHAPYASRFPFELRVLPKRHMSCFEELKSDERAELADAVTTLLGGLKRLLDDPPFNYLVHTAPSKTPGLLFFHWHIEIIPRLTLPAGFEWGTGAYINPLFPEDAAAHLRQSF